MTITIHVPEGSRVIIKNGDSVDFGTPLFDTPSQYNHSVPIAQKLGVAASKIFNHLKKFVGEDVKKGDVIAIKKGLFSSIKIKSDYEGKIKEIDHSLGTVIITSKGKKNTINSQIKGEAAEIKDKKISIKIKEGKEYDLKKGTADFGGKVWSSDQDAEGKIFVAESISSYNQSKMEALGIAGYVTLLRLPDETDLPSAQIKTIGELKEIEKHIYPYCYIDSSSSKIIFYK